MEIGSSMGSAEEDCCKCLIDAWPSISTERYLFRTSPQKQFLLLTQRCWRPRREETLRIVSCDLMTFNLLWSSFFRSLPTDAKDSVVYDSTDFHELSGKESNAEQKETRVVFGDFLRLY